MNRSEMLRRLAAGSVGKTEEEIRWLALELSIEKWHDIRTGKGENDGTANCALCETNKICEDCLVGLKTGLSGCFGTPLKEYIIAERSGASPEELERLAGLEEDFLKSLRPKKETEQ